VGVGAVGGGSGEQVEVVAGGQKVRAIRHSGRLAVGLFGDCCVDWRKQGLHGCVTAPSARPWPSAGN